MKIQDALTQNKEYWKERVTVLEKRLGSHQGEVQSLAKQLTEAQIQIQLYDRAQELLTTLDPVKVDAVDVVQVAEVKVKP